MTYKHINWQPYAMTIKDINISNQPIKFVFSFLINECMHLYYSLDFVNIKHCEFNNITINL